MPNGEEIGKLKTYFVDQLYSATRREQQTDDSYYKDNFSVPQIEPPIVVQRTGRASRLIDAPAEHIVSSNPQAFVVSRKDTKGAEERILRKATEINRWMQILKRQNPNPLKEYIKNLLLRGEAWIYLLHNERWVVEPIQRLGLPVSFIIPDPMIVYADPSEDDQGIPARVVLYYERDPFTIQSRYPKWSNPKNAGDPGKTEVTRWLEYWDNKRHYAEADGETVIDTKNVYGFVPFVHKLSGFGKSSPEGKMEDLVVGRLRKSRDTLTRECALVSSLDSIIHQFANRNIDVQPVDDRHEIPANFADAYKMGAGNVHEIPFGIQVTKSEVLLPEQQIFAYLGSITAQLEREDPLVMAGMPVGETGRLQDMVAGSAMRRYDTIAENTEHAFATSFQMAFEICRKIPTLVPEDYGVKKEDLEVLDDRVDVMLKADDPIDKDRKATLGSRLMAAGEIDPVTNLVEYKGYTRERAQEILVDILKWRVLLQSPDIAELIGLRAAEKSGMAEDLAVIKMRRQNMEKNQAQLGESTPPTGMQRMTGEVGSPAGREMVDMALQTVGARRPPTRYTRGG